MDVLQTLLNLPWGDIVNALVAAVAALIAFFALIPGEQPEKALKGFADFIAKFSRK